MIWWLIQKFTDFANLLGDLTADAFWGLVTSYPIIGLLGIVAIAGFAVAHLPMQRFVPQLAAYARVASIVCLVASAWACVAFGYRIADGRAEIERLKNDLAWSDFQLEQQRQVADTADALKRQAEAETSEAKGKLSEYESKFGTNPLAPPPGYLEWLRSLQQHPDRRARAQPRPSGRGIVARVRAIGGSRQ